jgi:hypothetical protein
MSSSCVSESVAASETHTYGLCGPRPRKTKSGRAYKRSGHRRAECRQEQGAKAWRTACAWRIPGNVDRCALASAVPLPTNGLLQSNQCVIINQHPACYMDHGVVINIFTTTSIFFFKHVVVVIHVVLLETRRDHWTRHAINRNQRD